MVRFRQIAAALFALTALPVAAQTTTPEPFVPGRQPASKNASNMSPADTNSTWSPALPVPMVEDNAPPSAFLEAAVRALAAGRTGEAQEAMERAESRALDRSVRPSRAGQPSKQSLVTQIAQARQALSAGDKLGALMLVRQAAANPDAAEPD